MHGVSLTRRNLSLARWCKLTAPWCRRPLPRGVMLLGFFLALMPIKLAEQVFLCANGIRRISGRSKEFAVALLAACHWGNLALISQEDEVALCHGADSPAQFQEYAIVRPALAVPKTDSQRAAYRSTLTLDGDRAIANHPKVAEACEWPRNVSGLLVRRDSVQAPAHVRGVIPRHLRPCSILATQGGCWGLSRGSERISGIGAPALRNLVSSGDNPEHSLQRIVPCWICGRRIKPEDCSLDEQNRAVHKSCLEIRNTLIIVTK